MAATLFDRSAREELLRHPAFGRMRGKHWGDLVHRHVDHHLRQFGA